MKLAIMQPYFFPYIGYFQAIHAVDKYVLYGSLNYPKKGWVNRNRILGSDGTAIYINAEIERRSSYKKINQIKLVNSRRWKNKLLHNIFYNYKKGVHFDEIYSLVEGIIAIDTPYLSTLNKHCVLSICRFLGIDTEIETDDDKYEHLEERLSRPEPELRREFSRWSVNVYSRKIVRVFEICRLEGADVFVNAIGGKLLYDKAEFRRNQIELFFIEMLPFTYVQHGPGFFPDLSIIDVLMQCGRREAKRMLDLYTFV